MSTGRGREIHTTHAKLECKCGDKLKLIRHTQYPAFGLEGAHVMVAVEQAGAYLGWRKTTGDKGRFYCPKCAHDSGVVCFVCRQLTCECPSNVPSITGIVQ